MVERHENTLRGWRIGDHSGLQEEEDEFVKVDPGTAFEVREDN